MTPTSKISGSKAVTARRAAAVVWAQEVRFTLRTARLPSRALLSPAIWRWAEMGVTAAVAAVAACPETAVAQTGVMAAAAAAPGATAATAALALATLGV